MNVWIVNHYAIPPSMGGLVRHYYFSKYLQKKGHKVKIFTSSKIHNTDINMIQDKSLYKEQIMDDVEYTFVRSRDYKGNGLDRIINIIDTPFKMQKAMKQFYKNENPDVIYTSSPDLFVAFFALLFGRKHKVPVVVEIRDLWPESIVVYNHISPHNPIIKVLYQLEKWIYIKADRLIFTMQGGKKYIKEKSWIDKIDLKKINYINNGVDLIEYNKNREQYHLEIEMLENKECYKVTYAGSVRKANGVRKLIEVAEFLKTEGYVNIVFLIFGDGNERKDLERYCEEKQLSNVIFYGKVEKKYIPYILSKSDVNFMHGVTTPIMRFGSSPNKLFDYIASGKPIVSDLQAEYDLIKLYGLGISVSNPTVSQIAKAIVDIIENYDIYKKEVKEHSKDVLEQYDYQMLTEKLENTLKF